MSHKLHHLILKYTDTEMSTTDEKFREESKVTIAMTICPTKTPGNLKVPVRQLTVRR